MVRIIFIGLLALSLFCMGQIMGGHDSSSGHGYHHLSASCATCMGPVNLIVYFFIFTTVGAMTWMASIRPHSSLLREYFRPPRVLKLSNRLF